MTETEQMRAALVKIAHMTKVHPDFPLAWVPDVVLDVFEVAHVALGSPPELPPDA